MTPNDLVETMKAAKASAILRTHDTAQAREAMNAAVRGGFRVVEFTLSIPSVLELVEEFSSREGLIVGVGTVLTPADARSAVAAGAKYLVSPVVDLEVIATAHELGVAVMPGCATPTEMLMAHRAGAQLQKLFPGPAGGPLWVKHTLGPLPQLNIVPTSGVTLENAAEFLAAGAAAVGFVASLFPANDLANERYPAIESRAKEMLAAIDARS